MRQLEKSTRKPRADAVRNSAALAATDQVKNETGGAARSSGRMHRGPRPREKDKEERTPPVL
jgi:hypothetical protein